MNTSYLLPIALLAWLPVAAQTSTITESRIQTNSGWTYQVHNDGSDSISAFYASFSCSGITVEQYFDPLIDYGSYLPISNGESTHFQLSEKAKDCPGGIRGLLFSKGGADGQAGIQTYLLARRRAAYEQLLWLDSALVEHERAGGSLDPLIAELKARRKSLENSSTPKADWSGGSAVLSFYMVVLQRHSIPLVPLETRRPLPLPRALEHDRRLAPPAAYDRALLYRLRQWEDDLLEEGIKPFDKKDLVN